MKRKVLITLLLFIISGISVIDLFLTPGKPTTFDGIIHISTIAQFSSALQSGDFPIIWLNSFANYGLPVGLFSQQLPIYVGALINLLVHSPMLSYNITLFIGIILANIFFYKFLRIYVRPYSAVIGTLLLTLTPLRIIDIYIRGDLPEVFASLFLPLMLLGTYSFVKEKKLFGLLIILFSTTGLILSHPMMFLVYAVVFLLYMAFLLWEDVSFSLKKLLTKYSLMRMVGLLLAIGIGFGITSYYVLPLFLEMKYFYFGTQASHLSLDQFLTWRNFFTEQWYYFYSNDIATRGQYIFVGIFEIVSLFVGAGYIAYKRTWKEKKAALVMFSLVLSLVLLFFTTPLSMIFYSHIHILDSLQFPWRFLAGISFLSAIIYAIVLDEINNKFVSIAFILLLCLVRMPQLYGKNYVLLSQSSYYGSLDNLESINMNTIWTGKTESYPARKSQGEIIDGKGSLTVDSLKNSSRVYTVNATTSVRLVDYTFFFPGWKVLVDNIPTTIQFQDPNYRGVITYFVPQGTHTVRVVFADTGIRKLAKLLSIFFLIISLGCILLTIRLRAKRS